MDTAKYLADAWAAVEEAGVPEHLHEVAFKAALEMLGGALPLSTTSGAASPPHARVVAAGADDSPEKKLPKTSGSEFFSKFAHETGIDQNSLEDVFYVHDGVPGLNVPARKLGSSRAIQTRAVTLAITAAYHFGLDESENRVTAVRRECERLKCFDVKNFNKYVGSTKGVNFTGPRTAKLLKTKPDTIPELRDLIAFIRGSEE